MIEFSHYFKKCPYSVIDVYRTLDLFEVTDPCIAHAVKKLLVPGGRGSKDRRQDVAEAIKTLQRRLAMWVEEDDAASTDR